MTIAVPIVGVPSIYSARPQDGRKMCCDTKRLWLGRAWGGTGKIFPANCLLSFTMHFSEDTAICGKKHTRKITREKSHSSLL